MSESIDFDFSFPRPFEQLLQANSRKRWIRDLIINFKKNRSKSKSVGKTKQIVEYMLDGNVVDLEAFLKNNDCKSITESQSINIRNEKNGVDVNLGILHLAVIMRQTNCFSIMIKTLIQNGIDLKEVLMKEVKVLQNDKTPEPYIKPEKKKEKEHNEAIYMLGQNVVFLAAEFNTDILEIIFDITNLEELLKEKKDGFGRTLLHLAASNSNNNAIKLLVNNGIRGYEVKDKLGYTPLHLACLDGKFQVAIPLA